MNILEEANQIVNGAREEAYAPPSKNFAKTVSLINAVLSHKLQSPLTPTDFGLIMLCVKLARFSHKPARDHLVDIAGYAHTIERLEEP